MLTRRAFIGVGAFAAATRLSASIPAWATRGASSEVLTGPLSSATAYTAESGGWRVLPAWRARRTFVLAGVSWTTGEPPGAIELRARRGGEPWSAWTPSPVHAGHGPDGRERRATDPVWTGPANELQVRVRGRSSGLRAAAVAARPPAPRARAAQAAPGPPGVTPRTSWGGDTVTPRDAPELGDVQVAFVHHTVNANDYGPEESAAMVLAIARYHRDVNGWDDLGYNFVVDRYGQVFEGRAGGMDQPVIGAQVQGFNHVSTGIACLGTFGTEALAAPAVEALARTIAWKLSVHGRPTSGPVVVRSRGGSENRFQAGTDVTLDRVSGHSDGGKTECPGAALHAQLPDIRARVAAIGGTVPTSTVAGPPRLEARLGARRVRARGRGVRITGSGAEAGHASLSVERQVAGLRFRFARRISIHVDNDGTFATRVRLPRPGVYRLTVRSGAQRVALILRSVRR